MKRKTRYRLGEAFPCACGRKILLDGFWLAAHWHEPLRRVCECGRSYVVKAGVVTLEKGRRQR